MRGIHAWKFSSNGLTYVSKSTRFPMICTKEKVITELAYLITVQEMSLVF